MASTARRLTGFLRRPAVIAGEVVAFGAASAIAASLPQQPDAYGIQRFAARWPALGRVAAALGLHDVVTAPWFLGVVTACLLSLVAVQAQQWPRLRRAWAASPSTDTLRGAPFRRSAPLSEARSVPERPRLDTAGRAALLGSPVFHLGLLVLIAAGLVRTMTFRDAAGRVLEGATLGTGSGAFEAERGGWLSRPLALERPISLREVREERYASGSLKQVAVRLALGGDAGSPATEREAAVNSPLDDGPVRLYVASAHGLAALVEVAGPGAPEAVVVFMEERGGEWRGTHRLGEGLELRFRANVHQRPAAVEVRAVSGGLLLRMESLAPGSELALGGGTAARLHGLRYWVQLRASRDPSRPLFYVGAVVVILGIILMFSFVRVDTGVFVEADRLVVALRPHRFAPLYAERFERLCKEWLP